MVIHCDDLDWLDIGPSAVKLDHIRGPGKEGIHLALDIEWERRGEAIVGGVAEVGIDCRGWWQGQGQRILPIGMLCL